MAPPPRRTNLLVDGYNIVGAWPSLTQLRDRDGLEVARQNLVEAMVNYSAFEGVYTQIIFDAQYQNTPNVTETVTEQVAVCYTDYGQTADTYIEKLCASLRPEMIRSQLRLVVATSDRAHRLTVQGYGAEWMSPQQLAADVEGVAQRVRRKRERNGRSPQRMLMNNLDPAVQKRLTEWLSGSL